MLEKFIAICLRGGGVLGKFLLTFLITKEISLEFQGEFSLMSVNVALLVMFVGLDFYIYSNRLIVKDSSSLIFVFKNSMVFYLLAYIMLIPLTALLFYFDFVQREFILIFFVLVILEHLGQELFRIYIAIENVVFANILFFLKSGVWSWVLVGYIFFSDSKIMDLYTLLFVWSIASFIGVILGIWFLPNIKTFFATPLNKKWILKGLKVGASLFIATVLLKLMEYSDRYLIDYYLNKKELGIYSFYYQIANIVNVIIFTVYISFLYPKILKNVFDQDKIALDRSKKKIYNSTIAVVLFIILLILTTLPYVLNSIEKPDLIENKSVLYLLVLSTLFFNFSFGSHFVLIAEEREKLIIKTTAIAFFINISLNLVLIPQIGILGASIAMVLSSLALWVSKFREEIRIVKQWNL